MMRRKLLKEGKEEEVEGRKALLKALLMIRTTIEQGQEETALPLNDVLKVELTFITRMT